MFYIIVNTFLDIDQYMLAAIFIWEGYIEFYLGMCPDLKDFVLAN